MGKLLRIFLVFFVLNFSFITQPIFAQSSTSSKSASLIVDVEVVATKDHRAAILRDYLIAHDSPLADYADSFIKYADAYDIDWKLLPAISGVESSFGNVLPYNSYNAWGWGIYGNHVIYFSSYDEAIQTISQALRENYINKGAQNVYQIGRIYAASPEWGAHVDSVMNQIDQAEQKYLARILPISL